MCIILGRGDTEEMGAVVYILAVLFGIITAIPAHELGHLIFGKMSGYSFVSYRVLNLLWVKDS
ncbi:MAG: hypothetical protein LBM93_13205, partial [Oscillospiraceae bacterium]|nr:hypothetical protein [Oscillospiraceae bacterium]